MDWALSKMKKSMITRKKARKKVIRNKLSIRKVQARKKLRKV